MSETKLQKSIVDELEKFGFWAWRVNAGTRASGRIKLAPVGTPDICVVSPSGWIEVKLPGNDLSDDQREWHARAKRFGVRVTTVWSVGEAVTVVNAWRSEDADAAFDAGVPF